MIKFKVIILLTILFTCDAHLRLLGDLISSTHEKIHSTVHGIAGTVLGGLPGINLHLDSHISINEQRQPQPVYQQQPNQNGYPGQSVDKVIVVIKEEEKYDHGPPPNGYYQQPNRPDNNYNQGPGYEPQEHRNYGNHQLNNVNPNNQGNHYNQGSNYHPPDNQQNPNQPHNIPEGNNYGNHQSNNVNPNKQGNDYNQGSNYRPQNNNQQNPNQPHSIPEGNNYGNQDPDYGRINSPVPGEITTKKPSYPDKEATTKRPDKDEPFFVPLKPNEYFYGGDEIKINEPKRETNKETQKALEDGVGNLDIRFKDD